MCEHCDRLNDNCEVMGLLDDECECRHGMLVATLPTKEEIRLFKSQWLSIPVDDRWISIPQPLDSLFSRPMTSEEQQAHANALHKSSTSLGKIRHW